MKNVFLFGFWIILSTSLGMVVSTSAFTSDEDLLDSLFSQAGITKTYLSDARELENLAGTGEDTVPFQNLYLFMLQNVMKGPQEAALQQLSETYMGDRLQVQFTEEELIQFLIEGNTQVMIDKYEKALADDDLATALTSEGILHEYNYNLALYENEFSFQMSNRKLTYEALAKEMFYNNDLSDSANIDILFDLDLVHYLLFGEYITYPDRSGDEPVDLASSVPEDEELDFSKTIILAEETAINPYACLESDAIVTALENYSKNPPEATQVETVETKDASTIDYDLGDDDSVGNSEAFDTQDTMEELDRLITELEGTAGNWTRALPCNDTFCITVDYISDGGEGEDSTENYEQTDNCIACHVAYISQRMEETTSRSLVPGKISMNWFEDATCKEAGSAVNLDLNIYLIKKPIDLDPGDAITTVPEEDIDELKTELWSAGAFPTGGGQKTTLGESLEDKVCKAILSLTETSDLSRSQGEVLDQCQAAADQIKVDTAAVYEEFIYNAVAKPANDFYSQVSAELFAILIQFQNFQEGLKDTYESENAPLPSLISKAYCQ